MRIHIRWKVVILLVAVIVGGIFLSYVSREGCDTIQSRTSNSAALSSYCNFPHVPAQGEEGKVPSEVGGATLKLQSVYTVIRHGDRSSLHSVIGLSYDNLFSCRFTKSLIRSVDGLSEYVSAVRKGGERLSNQAYAGYSTHPDRKECYEGELTPEGAAQQFRNGRFLRAAYIEKHALLDEYKFKEQVLIRGTTIGRTFQSAVAFMHGLLGSSNVNLAQLRFERAENNTMCVLGCDCPSIRPYLDSFSATFPRARVDNKIFKELFPNDPLVDDLRPLVSHIFDALVTHWCRNIIIYQRDRASCLSGDTVHNVLNAINRIGHNSISNLSYQRISRLKFAPLLREIAQRASQISRSNEPRFILYSGHDSTVEPLLTAMGVSNGSWPRYANRLIFEVYERQGGRETEKFVRILLNGIVITGSIEFCVGRLIEPAHVGLCSLKYLVDFATTGLLKSIGETSFSEACSKAIIR